MTVIIRNIVDYPTNFSRAVLDINEATERRKYKRVPFIEEVLIDGMLHNTTLDLSEQGLYISSLLPLMKNSIVEVTMPIKNGYIDVRAQVQFCDPGIGMGLQFIDLGDSERLKIKELIADITTKEPAALKKPLTFRPFNSEQ